MGKRDAAWRARRVLHLCVFIIDVLETCVGNHNESDVCQGTLQVCGEISHLRFHALWILLKADNKFCVQFIKYWI